MSHDDPKLREDQDRCVPLELANNLGGGTTVHSKEEAGKSLAIDQLLSVVLGSNHKQPSNPEASRIGAHRNVGDVKQLVARL
jgi:hypothetical protein